MNNRNGHLEEGELLRLIDGELPDPAATAARGHIEDCWSCRTQFQEIETAIGEYVRYQKTTDPWLPPPPKAWPELQFQTAGSSDRKATELFTASSRRRFDWRWAAAAAALLTVIAYSWREQTPAERMSSLLRNSSAATPYKGSIRIRTSHRALVRPAVLGTSTAGEDDRELRGMFERAHFSWEQPLSAQAFAAWRNELRDKDDSVRLEKGGATGDAYIIRTATHSSELRRASMTLRAQDFRPVRAMLEFTGETVEVEQETEVAPTTITPGPLTAAPPSSANRENNVPETQAALSPVATLHRMLQVFTTLHRLGADLGEPVEIQQSGGKIEVAAIGLSDARQQQLRAALEAIPEVAVRFDTGRAEVSPARPARKELSGASLRHSAGQSRLEGMLGSAQAAEEFTDHVLDASDAVLARVHALRALAQAFAPGQEAAMNPADRELLVELRKAHVSAMDKKLADLRGALQPLVGSTVRAPATAGDGEAWQTSTQKLVLAGQQLDEVLNRELAGDAATGSDFGLISKALSQFERQASTAAAH